MYRRIIFSHFSVRVPKPRSKFHLKLIHYYYYSVFCLTTGPKPLRKRFLHIVRSKASSFKWEYPLLSLRSSSSFLRLLPLLLPSKYFLIRFLLIILKFDATLPEIINTETAGSMDHENIIVIHFNSSTFGGFIRNVHSISCSDKVKSGFVA